MTIQAFTLADIRKIIAREAIKKAVCLGKFLSYIDFSNIFADAEGLFMNTCEDILSIRLTCI